ncbi:MAG: hypothetical protein COA43_03265 [Robiginitomaculum sp.]|nr:MAG: hypothetical protein COA43_03265 [Robiginitomaculum sp.]
MLGRILTYDYRRKNGIISGEDGDRYDFIGGEFRGELPTLRVGASVDFKPHDEIATDIYLSVHAAQGATGNKDKIVAALLAFFLGGLGIHKFYLGKTSAGVIMLLMGTIGWLLILPGLAVCIIAFIEFIIYLTKSDQDFHDQYVLGNKAWF